MRQPLPLRDAKGPEARDHKDCGGGSASEKALLGSHFVLQRERAVVESRFHLCTHSRKPSL
jgi:hypothetical protein